MRKKDILELKRRLKKDDCTFTQVCGCYVDHTKSILLTFRESFLNLEDEEYFKYLEIARKVLSGTVGNHLLELPFSLNENYQSEKQLELIALKKSRLKDDALLQDFYQSIIDRFEHTGNFLILLFHDAYDVITKTSDNNRLDESEEVYEYILCAICPVSLSKAGLRYFEDEKKIKARIRDWVVENPTLGFVFPAFISRSSDVNALMYYTKNPKKPHTTLMEEALGCVPKQPAALQKQAFQEIVKESIEDEEKAEKVFMEIQENLHIMVDEYNATYEDTTDYEPILLKKDDIQSLLIDSGIPEEDSSKIEAAYTESFSEDLPLAESLIDPKVLKMNEQRKKEKHLEKQVETLQQKLEQVTLDSSDLEEKPIDSSSEYDVIVQVKPEKVPSIKTQVMDGKKCIVIPLEEDEHITVNGSKDLL